MFRFFDPRRVGAVWSGSLFTRRTQLIYLIALGVGAVASGRVPERLPALGEQPGQSTRAPQGLPYQAPKGWRRTGEAQANQQMVIE